MNYPNLLNSRLGRMTALFLLYASKGIPWGFASLAIVNQMSSENLSKEMMGWYFSSLSWPWAIKWMFGPAVDLFYSKWFGRRRTWLVLSQIGMILTLLLAWQIDFNLHIRLFVVVFLIHNIFAATQGVAMGALACNYVPENERGLANGLMSAGAFAGTALGGSGAIFLIDRIGFSTNYLLVAGSILIITLTVTLNLREPTLPEPEKNSPEKGSTEKAWKQLFLEIRTYLHDAVKSFGASREAFYGMIFALLPPGAFVLSMGFATTFPKQELLFSNDNYALLSAVAPIISAFFCIFGGLLSDRFGRRRIMTLSIVGVTLPTLALAVVLEVSGIFTPKQAALLSPDHLYLLVVAFWIITLVYSALQGIGYSVQTAIFMDVTSPLVAATQFTAYTALMNFMRSYYSALQGSVEERLSYPTMLTLDCGLGLLCLIPLFFMTKKKPVLSESAPATSS